ncbi:GNAT family N-acetyltransferase [Treponema zuelzerae]|uniref:GNAT family N-acetyltransferase n=1 Tax=Teretinema zuelzerae TaxID=156 RepID=A0AAE3JK57_9SPIR|nr:GNAT family N-acetyltransferase [Teretinema zuelzerae]MCD1656111.1 GNAT family N-acetyltransferase [Teretinema zuelzerae]
MDLTLEVIETERLLLVLADLKFANEIFKNFNSETTKYMYPKPANDISETIDFLSNSILEMKKGTNYQVIITKKDTHEFIGCAGLHDLTSEIPELGIWIKKESFGNKYGQETIKGIVNWAVKQNKWNKARYPVDKRNISSRKIPESLNGIIVKEFKSINMSNVELDEVEYEVSLEKDFA